MRKMLARARCSCVQPRPPAARRRRRRARGIERALLERKLMTSPPAGRARRRVRARSARSRARSRGATARHGSSAAAGGRAARSSARPAWARSSAPGSSGCGGVRQHHQHVHLGAQIHGGAGARLCPAPRRSAAVVVDADAHEEIHVGRPVRLPRPVLAELDQEVVARVAVKVVAQLPGSGPRRTCARAAAASPCPADGVVPAAACPRRSSSSTRPMSE